MLHVAVTKPLIVYSGIHPCMLDVGEVRQECRGEERPGI